MSIRFSFPNPVNDVAARTVAAGVVAMAVVAIAADAPWLTIPLAYGFIARVGFGPRFSPLGRFASSVVAPRLGKNARLTPGPPKRFAQAMGAVFTTSALIAWVAGAPTVAFVLLGILFLPATAEATAGYCVGCEIFRLLMRRGVIPPAVCEECASFGQRWAPGGREKPISGSSGTEERPRLVHALDDADLETI
jgi:hypothetical protein